MGLEDMEKDMAAPVEAASAAGEEAVKEEENGDAGASDGDISEVTADSSLLKSAANELNSQMSHEVLPEDVDREVPDHSPANGSFDAAAEAPPDAFAESEMVSGSLDPDPSPVNDVQDTTEKGECEDLSEALAESVLEESKPKISAPVESADSIVDFPAGAEPVEDSAGLEPLPASSDDVQDKPDDSEEDAREVATVLPSESADNEDVSPELSGEGSPENVDSEALNPHVEELYKVVKATTIAEPDEELAGLESLPAPSDDVQDISVEMNTEDAVSPSDGADNEHVSPEDSGEGEALAQVEKVDEVAEATSIAEPDEESAGLEAVPPPSDDVEEKSVEVDSEDVIEMATKSESADNEDVSPELSDEVSLDKVEGEALDAEVEEVDDVSPEVSGEGSSDKVEGEAPAQVEEVEEVAEATTSAEPDEESASLEAVPPSFDNNVEGKSVEVDFEDASEVVTKSESADNEDVSPELADEVSPDKVEGEALDAQVEGEALDAQVEGEALDAEVEGEALDAEVEEVDDVSPEVSGEGSSDKVEGEAPAQVEEVEEVAEATTSAEPDEESASLEAEPPSFDINVEGKSVEVDFEDASEVVTKSESADNEDVSPELADEVSPDKVEGEALDAHVEEVDEVVDATTSAMPDEKSASLEAVPVPVEVNSKDACEVTTESENADNEDVRPESSDEGSPDNIDSEAPNAPVQEVDEVVDAIISAEPDEESASPEAVPAPSSDDVQSTPEEVKPGVSASEMEEESDHEQSEAPDEGSADNGIASLVVDTVTDVKVNNTAEHTSGESLDVATSADVPDNSRGLSTEETSNVSPEGQEESGSAEVGIAQTDRSLQGENFSQDSEVESQSRGILIDAEANAGDEEEIAETGVMTKEERPDTQSVSANEHLSDSSTVSNTEEILSNPLERASEDSSDAVVDQCDKEPLAEELEHPTTNASSAFIDSEAKDLLNTGLADDDASNVAINSVEDVSHLLQAEMTDEEVKLAAIYHPEDGVTPEESVKAEIPALESEIAHEESSIPVSEASGASQATEFETASKAFTLSDSGVAPTTSDVVQGSGDESHDGETSDELTPYLATALTTASIEKDNSLDAAKSDATLLASSPQPVYENEEAPKCHKLDVVATKLHDAAEKALEDAKSSNIGERQDSVAQNVAQIVLNKRSNTGDSSEYISGIVQHVAQFAQDAGQSDPNVLPDTVARIFDGETADSPANEGTQSKGTSLGNMVSLFIVWCVSLCASHISSKDMPAPALKLAAEEVTAVLHSNAPSTAQETATSRH